MSRLSPPGPIPLIYLQIKGLFSFPSTATARQTQQSLLSYFPLGPGAGGRWWHLCLRPWKTPSAPQTRLRIHSGLSPKASSPPGLPQTLCLGFCAQNEGVGDQELVVEPLPSQCCQCQDFQLYPRLLFWGLGLGVTVWAQASQLCLTSECRKAPMGQLISLQLKTLIMPLLTG